MEKWVSISEAIMRISNKKELKALLGKGSLTEASKRQAMGALNRKTSRGRKRRSVGEDIVCSIEPTMPANILYHNLVKRYGRHYSGGLLVMELAFTPCGRRWRIDMAMPSIKLGIEMDGWKSHGLYRESFLRDREKSLWFERRGWRIIRFSANQVREQLDDVLLAVEEIMAHCQPNMDKGWLVKQVDFDRSEYSYEYK